MGALRCGLDVHHTATKMNELGFSPDKNPIDISTVARLAKKIFRVLQARRRIIKTVSLDKNYAWAKTRLTIMIQFKDYLRKKEVVSDRKSLCGKAK